jgi:hypothetical protein
MQHSKARDHVMKHAATFCSLLTVIGLLGLFAIAWRP